MRQAGRQAPQRSFLPSLAFFPSCCSDWSSLMATITYATNTTLAMMAAVAPAKVELPGGWKGSTGQLAAWPLGWLLWLGVLA